MSATEKRDLEDFVGAATSTDLKRQVRMAAATENVTMAEYIRQALEDATAETLE